MYIISSILVSTLWHVKDFFPDLILEDLSRTLTVGKKVLFVFKNGNQLFFELSTTVNNLGAKWLSGKKLISRPATEMAILNF